MAIPSEVYGLSIAETRKYRADLTKRAQALWTRADSEKRDLNPEEKSQFDKMMADVESIGDRVTELERMANVSQNGEADSEREEGDEPEERSRRHQGERRTRPMEIETRDNRKGNRYASPEYRDAFRHYLETGERRDLILGTNSSGGYLVTPVELANEIVKQIENLSFVRQLATVKQCNNSKSYGVPQMTFRMSDFDWTTEVGSVNDDTTMAFGRRDLTPVPLTKLIKVSIQEDNLVPNTQELVSSEFGYKYGVTEENVFQNGSGSGQPLGLFTASSNGIPTSQDTTTASSGTFVADDLIKARYAIKQPYLADPSARWIFNRSLVGQIAGFKDQYGQYLWKPGLASNAPDTILGIPVCTSEYTPNTVSSGDYIGILGALRYYWIAEQSTMQIQRLVELFAGNNYVGYIARRFLDASPVLGEAFTRIKVQ